MASESETHHEPTPKAADAHEAPHGNDMHEAPHAKKDMHAGTTADGGAAHNDVGFPPFNAETFAPQLIWLALTFTVLYLLMSRIALPRIGEIIEERADRIKRDLDTAERLKSETEKALNAYEQALADARSNASEIAKETRDKLAGEVATERTRVDAEINAKVEQAEASIAETKKQALASVNQIAGEVASSLVSKLIGGTITEAEAKAAVDQTTANS